ncbi:MAG: IgGFc-binding protein [Myxococcales bacterium]|nr:IgGFc-binding protein [Myxococcales bacterium]
MRTLLVPSASLLLLTVAACTSDDTATSDTATGTTAASASAGTSTSGATATATATATTSTSGASGSGTVGETTGGATSTSGVSATAGECSDRAEQCKRGAHQVCEGGMWIDSPCADGEYCDELSESCVACSCQPGELGGCVGNDQIDTCKDDCSGFEPQPCSGSQVCVDDACVDLVCAPDSKECVSDTEYHVCDGQGLGYGDPIACDPGSVCDGGECVSACAKAEAVKSNVGCEFWAVDMANLPPRDTYVYAVALSNPSYDAAVNIEIFDRNLNNQEQKIITESIDPRQVKVINLSGSNQGKQGYYTGDAGFLGTGIAKGRAFRIKSDLPIVATQFNPIGGASGYTTDASLLLPTHTLGSDYIHLAWSRGYGAGSSLVIVATEDATKVTVSPNENTSAGMNGLPAMTKGAPTDVMLDRYDYIQLQVGPNGPDLSGSIVASTAPVAVFGGHSCANIPNTSTTACDHVEEQIFPLETWGKDYVASRNPKRGNEPMLWRIIAAEDNTKVDFDPPTMLGASIMMNKGQMVEFQEQLDFTIAADDPILVAGYMLGCSATGVGGCPGDPYMVLMVPSEQFQSDYVFLVDSSYNNDFAKLVRPSGAKIDVACLGVVPENRWTKIGASNFEWATIDMNPGEAMCKPGTNEATGDAPFGIIVSGQSSAASYAYPGGLALKPINPQ